MNRFSRKAMQSWASLGPRFLPFADVATDDLPLSRLLRLSLFQVSVGMALVLLVGTLNRVMIVELTVPASLVGVMIALPIVFAPFRALIGFRSDVHSSALGWRRVPFIWRGTMLQFGGLAIMPFALLVLGGQGHANSAPVWIGYLGAATAFLLVGAGLHMVQTVGLALATDLAPVEDQPKVVGLMYVMLLAGMIFSALVFGLALENFSPGRLVQVIQASAVATVVLNVLALWKMEARHSRPGAVRGEARAETPEFAASWEKLINGGQAKRRLMVVGLGTLGFGMADVLLEPYGGQVLALSVADTTKLTAILAFGSLLGFAWASRVLGRGFDPLMMAGYGALVGVPGFLAICLAAPLGWPFLFVGGTALIGFGAGLFGHGTLTATMQLAPREQIGLALGTWGAVQATTAGVGIAFGSMMRDIILALPIGSWFGAATPYISVYALEILFLLAALAVIAPLLRGRATPGLSAS
ncbi:protein pucC [Hoeflea sp. BAL378]|uniref:PucC family protein n=1 Tax=Hoeflea sp. BAL378 TaxID=1547437 RepID=UPI000513207E|nr:PucC family protein [Hoeflea sp. BAL378]KGF70498.1 protein pucC [Hoeflea sp. BAL378]